jgi:hypothetical protein
MAPQAASSRLLRCRVFERENFALVSPSVDVFFSRTVAGFTTLPIWPLPRFQLSFHRGGEMHGRLEMVVNFFVAGFASIRAYVQGRIRRLNVFLGLCLGFLIIRMGFLFSRVARQNEQHREYRHRKSLNRARWPTPHKTPSFTAAALLQTYDSLELNITQSSESSVPSAAKLKFSV